MKQFFLLAVVFLSSFALSTPDPSVPLKASSVVGLWVLDGKVRAVQFNLKPNGTFQYKGYGSESQGKWNVEGTQVRFRWSRIDSMDVDGQKVTALNPMEDGALKVGKFAYRKFVATQPAPILRSQSH